MIWFSLASMVLGVGYIALQFVPGRVWRKVRGLGPARVSAAEAMSIAERECEARLGYPLRNAKVTDCVRFWKVTGNAHYRPSGPFIEVDMFSGEVRRVVPGGPR